MWNDAAGLTNGSGQPVTDYVFTNTVPAPALNPQEPLGALRGENPNGVWKLVVHDGALSDQGTLHSWGLQLTMLTHAPDVAATALQTSAAAGSLPDNGSHSI